MEEIINTIVNWINLYYGNAVLLMLAVYSYIYLLVHCKECKNRIIYPVLLIVFLIVNPVLYKYVFSSIVYWRLLWMLPNGLVIAYAIVEILKNSRRIIERTIILGVFVFFIVMKGTDVYKNGGFVQAQNLYKISNDVIEVCDAILESNENPRCIMPSTLYSEVRQYTGEIEMLYGRDAENYIFEANNAYQSLNKELAMDHPNYSFVLDEARITGCQYIVVNASRPIEGKVLSQYGYQMLCANTNYIVYSTEEETRLSCEQWIVTQYTSPSGNGTMCYTFEKDGYLVIVDGGYGWKLWELESVLKRHDYRINAWIMTYPHKGDRPHFQNYMTSEKFIIDEMYTVRADINEYEAHIETQEEYFIYYAYLEFLQQKDNIHYVKKNEKINIAGLNIEFLSVGNSWYDIARGADYNSGSLAFLVEGTEDKMLFCSDIYSYINSSLVQDNQKKLDVDYIQFFVNNIEDISYEFLELTSPEIIFLDETKDIEGDVDYSIYSRYFDEQDVKVFLSTGDKNGILFN